MQRYQVLAGSEEERVQDRGEGSHVRGQIGCRVKIDFQACQSRSHCGKGCRWCLE